MMDYRNKEQKMQEFLETFKSPDGFRSSYKAIPYSMYGLLKPYIDYTKYYVMFRGPRPGYNQSSTRKRDAKAFDIYMRDARTVSRLRLEREAFWRGVRWAENDRL